MNFDVVIIGGGIAGLTCGISLQQQGKRCAIINNGQAALDFSSGSVDLLSRLPEGGSVLCLQESFAELQRQLPAHPYVLLGLETVLAKAAQFDQLAHSLDLGLIGSLQRNHLRVTPLGGLRYSWLSPASIPALSVGENFPYSKIAILGIEGYHDFQPLLMADNLKQNPQFAHCDIGTGFLHIPELDQLRAMSREFRSVHIAQALEQKLCFAELVEEIKQAAQDADAVFLPACFGLDDQNFFTRLKQAAGLALFELPTLPPSLLGSRQHKKLRYRFETGGGVMMNGDRALRAEFEGGRVSKIFTQLNEEEPITADHYVLASGGFFSNGLVADFAGIYEPVFHADICRGPQFDPQDRFSWTQNRFSAPQPYQSAGVIINSHCRVQKNGEFLANLYAVGSVIGGYNGIELGCGSGVAVVTALTVADYIGGAQ